MANEHGYSHITVSPDEDDDIVIQAGLVEVPAEELSSAVGEPDGAAEGAVSVESDEPAKEKTPRAATQPIASPASAAPRAAEADSYRETTLEDIQGTKMTTTQKAVIVVALVGIAAFVLWYLLAQ